MLTDNAEMQATPLRVCELSVQRLRCHAQLTWTLAPRLNMLTGANGSGKTSLLEAVYLMAYGRSFRQARDPFLVQRGHEHFHIRGSWQRFGPMHLAVRGRRGQVSLRLQGRDVQRRKDVSESFPVLVEAPQGRRLVDGAPNERRRWLDGLVMTCFSGMQLHYERYLRAVMQRGRLLRRRRAGDEIEPWEQQIVRHGLPIIAARVRLLEEMNGHLVAETALTEEPLVMSLKNGLIDEQAWLERLRERRQEDMRVGGLRFGPHCDTLQMHYHGREIRSAGSRGQQKLAAVAIKMAECALWRQYRRLLPVLLLDDCLEALDDERQLRALRRLAEHPGQVLVTAPQGVRVSADIDIRMQQLRDGGLHATAGRDDHGSQTTMMEEAA